MSDDHRFCTNSRLFLVLSTHGLPVDADWAYLQFMVLRVIMHE